GKKQKFHLFKVSVEGEEGIESYLAIAGPYALGRQELISYADASGLYSDEPFNKNKIDNHLAAYLQHTAEYLKEEGKAK
ncbi:MAG TPA: hypothetical protein VNR87_15910, partial [Flavisolibacter sp.]|nr:hypothetical protein [Flavisolibacter sp.]